MKVIYAIQNLEYIADLSIFLAGPTPRDIDTKSWRPEAIALFEKYKFNGTLLIPEDESWGVKGNYDDQVEWEEKGLYKADCILFWIPRKIKNMPAFTTNDEWGFWKKSGKVVLGVPEDAEKCRYQIYYAKKFNVPFAETLEETIINSIKLVSSIEETRLKDICNSYI